MEGRERMRLRAPGWLRLYLTALGAAALVFTFVGAPPALIALSDASVLVWLLVGGVSGTAVIGGYLRFGANSIGGIGVAVPFAFALALTVGASTAALALGVGLLVSAARSWSPARLVIEAAIPVVAISAAGAAMTAIASHSDILAHPTATSLEFAAIAVGGALLFVSHVSLTAVAIALQQRIAPVAFVRQQLAAHASTGMVLLSLAPVVIIVATQSATLLPLLTLPVVAIIRSSRAVAASEHLALHDALTGLPNRRLFLERLAVALVEAQAAAAQVAILLIDLDRFKEVNDRLGHHVGDLLLQAIGPALAEDVGTEVTVARMGGDEFALCVPNCDGTDEAVRVAKQIIARLGLPFAIDSYTVDIGASIGIALFPGHAADVSTALQRADIAMYVAKETRGGYEVYSPERDPNRRQRISSPSELRRATELGQLVLHYQPKADVRTGRAMGIEALVRWNHPILGLVGPVEFIPLAERAGLMGPLTTFVLEQSLQQCARWRDQGVPLRLAVNVSVQSLYDESFPSLVASLFARSELDASQLVLDVTESTVMADPRRAQRVLGELGALGVTLAIDDFGTGYSSLAYLKQLPVSELKIDKSFVLGMATDSDDAVIVHSTIDLGQKFGLEVVAEGVESLRVWRLLERLGCDLAQGSYVCPPLPPEQLTEWLYDNVHRTRNRDDEERTRPLSSAQERMRAS